MAKKKRDNKQKGIFDWIKNKGCRDFVKYGLILIGYSFIGSLFFHDINEGVGYTIFGIGLFILIILVNISLFRWLWTITE